MEPTWFLHFSIEEHLHFLTEALKKVFQTLGTSSYSATNIAKYQIAGKTGTAQVASQRYNIKDNIPLLNPNGSTNNAANPDTTGSIDGTLYSKYWLDH